jgi:hypothetical protein
MRRGVIVVAVAVFLGASSWVYAQRGAGAQRNTLPVVEVYKDPTCGCCSQWVEHLKAAGFTVRTTESNDMDAFKDKQGVPARTRSCHTALVGGYVVEGHVPAADVRRMLTEKPAIAGLAVPGMPIGSPGMEVPGMRAQAYNTVAFKKDGSTSVFASH